MRRLKPATTNCKMRAAFEGRPYMLFLTPTLSLPPAYRQAGIQGEGIHSEGYASRFVTPLQELVVPSGLDTG
jgi:hypothetical protein